MTIESAERTAEIRNAGHRSLCRPFHGLLLLIFQHSSAGLFSTVRFADVGLAITAFLSLTLVANAQVKITIDHNTNATATSAFKFKNVPSPVKDDLAARAKLLLLIGEIDPNGADLSALTDGSLPTEEDQPSANFFFNALRSTPIPGIRIRAARKSTFSMPVTAATPGSTPSPRATLTRRPAGGN